VPILNLSRYRIASLGITGQASSQTNAQKEAQEDASPYPASTQQIEPLRAVSLRHYRFN